MSMFDHYAEYYNLLYQDKDYTAEAAFVDRQLQPCTPNTTSILDLGCGTGKHAILLAKAGYRVHGVDLSEKMLAQALHFRDALPTEVADRLTFEQGDIRQIRTGETFDRVISLFHVMSYQISNADLLASFATARAHLVSGGVFIFDFWYGPAVLNEQPSVRVKRLKNGRIQVTRIAEPTLLPNENWVNVHYQILLQDQVNQTVSDIRELHQMRYWFKPEIEFLLAANQLELMKCCEWMGDRPSGLDTWSVYCMAQG